MSNPKGIIIHPESQKAIDKLPDEAKRFINDLISLCIMNDITLKFKDKCTHNGDMGSFSVWNKTMIVCTRMKPDQWVSVAMHESCHMDQWLANSKYYVEAAQICYDIHGWLNHKEELSKWQLSRTINLIQREELDCEKRTVRKIMEYDLSHFINVDLYIKQANQMLYNYSLIKETRKWPPHNRVRGKYRKLYTDLPPYFLKSYKHIPTWFRKLAMEIIKPAT